MIDTIIKKQGSYSSENMSSSQGSDDVCIMNGNDKDIEIDLRELLLQL